MSKACQFSLLTCFVFFLLSMSLTGRGLLQPFLHTSYLLCWRGHSIFKWTEVGVFPTVPEQYEEKNKRFLCRKQVDVMVGDIDPTVIYSLCSALIFCRVCLFTSSGTAFYHLKAHSHSISHIVSITSTHFALYGCLATHPAESSDDSSYWCKYLRRFRVEGNENGGANSCGV